MPSAQRTMSTQLPAVNNGGTHARITNASTILVVENDPNMLEVVSLILEDAGYHVIQASSGRHAWDTLQENKPDLTVSDIMMSDMDGLELFERMHADPAYSQIPFIFLTARAARTDIRRGMVLGADDYLTKPFEPEDLLSAVETRLARAVEARALVDKASEELQKTIVQIVSHELRTPLAVTMGYTEYLEALGPDMAEEDLQMILQGLHSGTRRLMSLVEGLIILSKIKSGVLAGEIKRMGALTENPDQTVRTVVDRFESEAFDRNVSLVLLSGSRGAAVAADESHLAEMTRRLVDNAIRFSKQEGGQVTLTTRLDGASWVLEVADDGIGIRHEALPGVFEAFRQVDRDQMEQQGAGLGLAIVRGLAEQYGGRVGVESELSQGSTFCVELPLVVC